MKDYACPNCKLHDVINHPEYYNDECDGETIERTWFYTCPHCGLRYWYTEFYQLVDTDIEVVNP